ncbi:hypothetical protein [Terricaulis silvestris]|uniref:Uncharacterized protein n=1 Tax=Terricaulis silvestris TaxID=2686094 RepID=A0A6I6MMN1_9CAUL|nr:hypothetical protein [Terricaulis silvestris]QGZ94224.1 hypothetical protein DSM104635_01040 [Terricaulis silvestris]
MRALALVAAAVVLMSTAAAQTLRPAPQLRAASGLQQTADQRWAAVFAADRTYMQAVGDATRAEIALRRSRGENVAGLETELARMQEQSMSFSMQYLALQEKMQNESRQYALVAAVMRTKHDTVRNSISNVR